MTSLSGADTRMCGSTKKGSSIVQEVAPIHTSGSLRTLCISSELWSWAAIALTASVAQAEARGTASLSAALASSACQDHLSETSQHVACTCHLETSMFTSVPRTAQGTTGIIMQLNIEYHPSGLHMCMSGVTRKGMSTGRACQHSARGWIWCCTFT